MRTALGALASGQASQPLRSIVRFPAATGLMGLMPARLAAGAPPAGEAAGSVDSAAYGLKAICITPGNPALGLDTHQGIVLLSEGQTGEPLAVLNASAITEIRTAAVSVLATDVLARRGAGDLAVVGTGVQARAHVLAFARTRPLRRVRVAGRTPDRAEALAAALQPEMPTKIIVSPSVRDAVAGADIIVTATSSAEPVLRRDWIAAGAHINAVGACLPAARELDSAIIADAALFADSRESLLAATMARGRVVREESGFIVVQLCGEALQLGPFSALNCSTAEVLYETALRTIPLGTKVFLDAPVSNRSALRLFNRRGMRIAGRNELMYAGVKPDYRPEMLYGLATMGSCG